MVHVRLLGPLQVLDDDGRDVTPGGARERLCLATLAVDAPNSLSQERLATELYRERETTAPRNAVQALISRLRKGLGRSAGAVETTVGGYRLVDVTVDVDEAEGLLTEALTTTDPARAGTLLAEAEALWRGSTLEGLDGDLVAAERLRIDRLRADAADAVFRVRLDSGGDGSLVADLEAAVGREPGREQRWELLMLALYRAGQQAEALRVFQRARRHLSDNLGLEPGRALADLEQRILRHDPSLDLPVTPGVNPGGTPGLNPRPAPDSAPTAGAPGTAERGRGTATGSGDDGDALPSGTVTLLLCDVEGSVRRWEAEPTDTAADIATLHTTWGQAVGEAGGHVIKSTGDGVLAVFAAADDALTAGARALATGAGALTVRAAAYTGTARPVDGDYRGPVVNRCSRLLDLAHGGQFLVDATTAQLAATQPAAPRPADADPDPTIGTRRLGTVRLRDVAEPVDVFQVTAPGLAAAFPPLASRLSTPLPALRTELLGRTDLLDRLETLTEDHNLVTLLGPGGIGKTSLALATAWRLADIRSVVFVDLARVTDPTAVTERVIEAVGVPDHEDGLGPLTRLARHLRHSGELVVLDNAEHVLDEVAGIAEEVLGSETKATLLVTSRRPLGVRDEELVPVPPLDLPDSDDDLETARRSAAVTLFLDRVRSGPTGAEIPAGLVPVVSHICRRLDGIPLAIELAAGRASILAVDEIAARLDDQLRLLRQLQSTRDRRHRSLEAVVGWSVDQLSPSARELFDRLAVMSGPFDAAGAEALITRCGLSALSTLDDLEELAGASLVVAEPGEGRLRLLEPIRQYARAELLERGLDHETHRAHARWMADEVQAAVPRPGEGRNRAASALDGRAEQLMAAIDWLAGVDEPELILDIAFDSAFWFLVYDAPAGERLLIRLLGRVDRDDDEWLWANVVMAAAVCTAAHPRSIVADLAPDALAVFDAHEHPDRAVVRVAVAFALAGSVTTLDTPRRLLQEASDLVSSDDTWSIAVIDMGIMSIQALMADLGLAGADTDEAVRRGDRAADTFRRLGEDWALGVTLGELGRLCQGRGDYEAAEQHFEEGLALLAASDYHGRHYILTELGRLATDRGQHDLAERHHVEALEIANQYDHPGCLAMTLAGMAHAADGRGDRAQAIGLYRQALELSRSSSTLDRGGDRWAQALSRLEADAVHPDA